MSYRRLQTPAFEMDAKTRVLKVRADAYRQFDAQQVRTSDLWNFLSDPGVLLVHQTGILRDNLIPLIKCASTKPSGTTGKPILLLYTQNPDARACGTAPRQNYVLLMVTACLLAAAGRKTGGQRN